ncbi:hypothetical protein BAC1_00318 [uncultured bacterium]|nr:hypothetical protein BAC1_00318 [uncultured bacterium]
MRNLKLAEMLLVSHKEKKARKIKFHPEVTVIQGENDTGKSSLIKSIYYAFGADPVNIHHHWTKANISTLVRFEVQGTKYSIYRHGKSFSLFSSNDQHLGTFSSITNELAPKLADLFYIKLRLVDQSGNNRIPPPAYFFLPFYIDQDGGWIKNLSSFDRLGQFKNWRKDLVFYHTGIRPNAWYELNSEARMLKIKKDEPVHRERIVNDMIRQMKRKFTVAGFDIDVAAYKKEIDQLLNICEELRKNEEAYRGTLVELETERVRLEAQKEIIIFAKQELQEDYSFAYKIEEDHIDCPTCGAGYSNAFAERFSIACDEDRCVNLLQKIQESLIGVEEKIQKHRKILSSTSAELHEVQKLLSAKQGRISLKDLIKNEGKKEVSKTLDRTLTKIHKEISYIDSKIRDIEEKLKEYVDRKRTTHIINEYSKYMRSYLNFLDVKNIEEATLKKIDANIKESGSDLPRALLGYFFSILHVIKANDSALFCPIVIDAPNQQEQDQINIKKMLEFIRDRRPAGSQLILGFVDDYGIDFKGEIISLTEKYSALSRQEYQKVSAEMEFYENANLRV